MSTADLLNLTVDDLPVTVDDEARQRLEALPREDQRFVLFAAWRILHMSEAELDAFGIQRVDPADVNSGSA